jgi:flagellar assembly protein FliH
MPIPKEKMTAWQRWEMADFSEKSPPVPTPVVKTPVVEAPPPPPPPPPVETSQPAYKLPTLDEIEQIHQQAHKDGYAAGYEEGTARVRMEAMRLHSLNESLDQALAMLDEEIADELLALALEIARQVIRQQIAAKPAIVLNVIKEALLQLPHLHAALFLHPEDATLVKSFIGDQLSHAGHRILEEPGLERGGCRVEAASSQIDGTLETRWRRVVESMGLKDDWIDAQEDDA